MVTSRYATSALSLFAVGGTNVAAWLKDFNAGAFLSAVTFVGLGAIALFGEGRRRLRKIRDDDRTQAAETEANLRRREAQLQVEIDEIKKGSLSAQIEAFRKESQAAAEAAAETIAFLKERIVAANEKIHQANRDRQADNLDNQRPEPRAGGLIPPDRGDQSAARRDGGPHGRVQHPGRPVGRGTGEGQAGE